MAGHSHYKNMARHKAIVDAKRGKLFSKLSRYIIIAAKARDALTGTRAQLVNRVAGVILILAAAWLALQTH